jgi:hypothetical protein
VVKLSRRRPGALLLIAAHLTALLIGSIPPPSQLSNPAFPEARGVEPISAWLTPRLDAAAAAAARVHLTLWNLTSPLRPIVSRYLGATGLDQQWAMFWNPSLTDQYVRVRYYVGSGAPGTHPARVKWLATELVSPAHREDRVRLLASFHDSYSDKAMEIAMGIFRRKRGQDLVRPDTTSAELPDSLAPLARYFARRFARARLTGDDRVVRVEVWSGSAPNPEFGSAPSRAEVAERQARLGGYYDGPVERHLGSMAYPPYHAAEDEADIQWVLEYFEES